MILRDNETVNVIGGASWLTAAMVNAVSKIVSAIYGFGQNLGSAIYRLVHKQHC